MSFALFKNTIYRNYMLLLIFFGVLTMYTTIMISMFDPDDIDAMLALVNLMPEDLLRAMGFTDVFTSLTTYLASWLYGLLMFGFPMVYCIILGNRLLAKTVDNGSMAYLLSTPTSRVQIVITQGIYALLSILILFTALFAVGVLTASAIYPGLLDINNYLKLNITTMLINMLVMMITFFFSALFNETRFATGFGAAIPIAFLLMNMLGNASEQAQILSKISIYGMHNPVGIANGESAMLLNLIFLSAIILLFAGSVMVFNKKQLPL